MSELVRTLWMMSVQASILIIVILGMRLVLCNCRKVYSYCLWFLVLARLLCPVFIESSFSLQPDIPVSIETDVKVEAPEVVPNNQGTNQNIVTPIQPVAPPTLSENEMSEVTVSEKYNPGIVLQWLYLTGVAGFSIYFLIQYFRMHKRVAFAIRDKENIWLCDAISSPFVMGVIKPKIYLPMHISGREKVHILRHECVHIAHKDPLVRLLGSMALILHWWNPLVWYAIHKMNQDMEMFCDETALADASLSERKAYSNSLLQFSMRQSGIAVTLSFGESNTELRIRNVLRKKRTGIVIRIFVVIVAALCGITFLTVPKNEEDNSTISTEETETQEESETQQAESEQETEQLTENSETTQVEFTVDDIYGDWLVYHQTDFGGISALSTEEQMNFNNMRLHYDEESCKYYDAFGHYQENVNIIQYTSEYMTKEAFEEGFKGCNFSSFPWENAGVNYVQAVFDDKNNRFGSHIYVCEKDEILIYYEGAFFLAMRMSEEDIANHEGLFYYEDVTNLSRAEVEAFAGEVRSQILEGDWTDISEKLIYPITIAGITCQNANEFLALDMDRLMTEDFLQKIEAEDCEYLFHNWQGIMMGETGQIWFAEVLDDAFTSQGLKIIAINISEETNVSYENEAWYKAYQTILTDWTSIDNYGDFSYLKGYFDNDYSFDNYYLCDVDSNGVPEFFLHSDYMNITAIFTFSDGKICYLMDDVITGINKETAEIIIYSHWHGAGGSGVNEWSAYQITNDKAIDSLYIDYYDSEKFDMEGLEKPYTIYTLDNPNYEKQETSEAYDKLYAIHIQPALSWKTFERYDLEDSSGLNYIQ